MEIYLVWNQRGRIHLWCWLWLRAIYVKSRIFSWSMPDQFHTHARSTCFWPSHKYCQLFFCIILSIFSPFWKIPRWHLTPLSPAFSTSLFWAIEHQSLIFLHFGRSSTWPISSSACFMFYRQLFWCWLLTKNCPKLSVLRLNQLSPRCFP